MNVAYEDLTDKELVAVVLSEKEAFSAIIVRYGRHCADILLGLVFGISATDDLLPK
jgi:hypothetical protein